MRKYFMIFLALLVCVSLAGCCMEHQWVEATCAAAKTCAKCGKTEGEPLPHTWADATCQAPKTCSVCGAEEGEPVSHTWADATCLAPKTCTQCQTTEGEAAGHDWAEATMRLPKTCRVCSATEGTSNNYFSLHGIPVEDYLPSEFESTVVYWSQNRGNQHQVSARFTDVEFYVPKQEKEEGVKEVAPRFRVKFDIPANTDGFYMTFDVFDLYTGQVVPFRDETDYEVSFMIDGEEVVVRMQDWAVSDWTRATDTGWEQERYIWANLYVPADYDGLVLAVAKLKYYGYDDQEWADREAKGLMAGDYFEYPDYYEGATFYRLVPDPNAVPEQ